MQLLRDNHTLHVTLFTRAVPAHESLTIYTPHFKPVFLQLCTYVPHTTLYGVCSLNIPIIIPFAFDVVVWNLYTYFDLVVFTGRLKGGTAKVWSSNLPYRPRFFPGPIQDFPGPIIWDCPEMTQDCPKMIEDFPSWSRNYSGLPQ